MARKRTKNQKNTYVSILGIKEIDNTKGGGRAEDASIKKIKGISITELKHLKRSENFKNLKKRKLSAAMVRSAYRASTTSRNPSPGYEKPRYNSPLYSPSILEAEVSRSNLQANNADRHNFYAPRRNCKSKIFASKKRNVFNRFSKSHASDLKDYNNATSGEKDDLKMPNSSFVKKILSSKFEKIKKIKTTNKEIRPSSSELRENPAAFSTISNPSRPFEFEGRKKKRNRTCLISTSKQR